MASVSTPYYESGAKADDDEKDEAPLSPITTADIMPSVSDHSSSADNSSNDAPIESPKGHATMREMVCNYLCGRSKELILGQLLSLALVRVIDAFFVILIDPRTRI